MTDDGFEDGTRTRTRQPHLSSENDGKCNGAEANKHAEASYYPRLVVLKINLSSIQHILFISRHYTQSNIQSAESQPRISCLMVNTTCEDEEMPS
jgi:hypothetical protein